MLAKERVAIYEDDFREDLSERMAAVGADLMLKVLRDLERYDKAKTKQGEEGVTYGKK